MSAGQKIIALVTIALLLAEVIASGISFDGTLPDGELGPYATAGQEAAYRLTKGLCVGAAFFFTIVTGCAVYLWIMINDEDLF